MRIRIPILIYMNEMNNNTNVHMNINTNTNMNEHMNMNMIFNIRIIINININLNSDANTLHSLHITNTTKCLNRYQIVNINTLLAMYPRKRLYQINCGRSAVLVYHFHPEANSKRGNDLLYQFSLIIM